MGKDQSVLRVDIHHEVAVKKGYMPTVRGMDREVRTVSLTIILDLISRYPLFVLAWEPETSQCAIWLYLSHGG